MITKEKFDTYLQIRNSGKTNMFNVSNVIRYSNHILNKEDCIEIMSNFDDLEKQFGNQL